MNNLPTFPDLTPIFHSRAEDSFNDFSRSEEQLHKAPAAPVMVEYLRPVGILTSNR